MSREESMESEDDPDANERSMDGLDAVDELLAEEWVTAIHRLVKGKVTPDQKVPVIISVSKVGHSLASDGSVLARYEEPAGQDRWSERPCGRRGS